VQTLELNLDASGGRFDAVREGAATEIVPEWVAETLAKA